MDAPGAPPMAAMTPVLQAVGTELAALGEMGVRLQALFGALSPPGAVIEEVQLLDLLAQRLFALAGFTASLAPHVPPCSAAALGDALAGVTLADVARRLVGDHVGAATAGEFEPFGDLI